MYSIDWLHDIYTNYRRASLNIYLIEMING
jgi:hypothetical protein